MWVENKDLLLLLAFYKNLKSQVRFLVFRVRKQYDFTILVAAFAFGIEGQFEGITLARSDRVFGKINHCTVAGHFVGIDYQRNFAGVFEHVVMGEALSRFGFGELMESFMKRKFRRLAETNGGIQCYNQAIYI
jgi:hypothetical protein